MNTDLNPSGSAASGKVRRPSFPLPNLNPNDLGLAFGATGLVFYLGCMLTMAIVPREKVVIFFNSLLHGFDVEPVLKTGVPASRVALGMVATFILAWFAGVLIAGIYNLSLRMGK